MEENIIVEAFAYIPHINDLKCIICESYPSDNRTSSSFYCSYICRIILNELSDVLVAPNNSNNTIYIIFANNETFMDKIGPISLLNEKLKFIDTEVLIPEIYTMCLAYSTLLRISPEWINVDKYYICSKDFRDYKETVNAVEVNFIKQSDIILKIELNAVIINMTPYFEPKTCTPSCWKQYSECKTGFINITLSQQVYVLPSMRKGTIISISKSIANNSIREDWLNQYGYLLPDEIELSYCKVKHSESVHDVLIYPSVCLLAKPLHIIKSNVNHIQTIANFLKVFIRKNVNICGQMLELMGKQELENRQSQLTDCSLNAEEINREKMKFKWEECNECSQVGLNTQNYDTLVTIPFDDNSIKSLVHPTSTVSPMTYNINQKKMLVECETSLKTKKRRI